MVDKKISELDSGGTPGATDVVPGVKSGATVKFTIAALATAVSVYLGLGDLATLDTVGSAQITDDSVSIGDLADGTDGQLITWGADGEATTVATGNAGQVLVSNGAGTAPTFQTPPVTLFSPDVPPASPSAYDDEFLDATASAALWSAWNPGSNITTTYNVAHKRVKISALASGSDKMGGIYQAVPSVGGEWTTVTRCSLVTLKASTGIAGSFVSGDIATNPTTADVAYAALFLGSSTLGWQAVTVNDYTIAGAVVRASLSAYGNYLYMRNRMNGDLWSVDVSWDGIGWTKVLADFDLNYNPTHMGLFANTGAQSNPATSDAVCTFFRVFPGVSAFDQDQLGGTYTVFN